jgi:hypothetical protein
MNKQENILRMTYEIAMGYKWGHATSLIEQTEENRSRWERMAHQVSIAKEHQWIVEIPFD